MDIYKRYASGEHDREFFAKHNNNELIKLRPLLGQFDNVDAKSVSRPVLYWQAIFPQAAFFAGYDHELFGHVVTVVYKNEVTSKLSAVSITKYGCNVYENLLLDVRLRFWPACENLDEKHKDSNVRRALAIANLKNHNQLHNNSESFHSRWDETNAGALASSMDVLTGKVPVELGEKLLQLGLLQDHWVSSTLVDVVYDSKTPLNGENTIEENNKLVFALGKQMDQLFDPLLEYSPQAMDYHYVIPQHPIPTVLQNNVQVNKVLDELFDVQANYAMDLIAILQDLINPLRAKVLSSKSSLGIQKVNLIFPPTIDEICRINCILHDSLSRARKYGYVEVFHVFENILPYFYKAFIRHEANLRNFHSRLSKFLEKESKLMSLPEINRRKFSARSIEAIVSGSILELPRLKLILKRLHSLIEMEKARYKDIEQADNIEAPILDRAFNTCVEIIDSFGYNEQEQKPSTKNRVFTPSGKLLTEIATEWPNELQYGWINRKVIGVHEMKEVISTPASSQILIIFSDSLLFLDLFLNETDSSLLVPSVLMNSLINEKPLPKLSQFPQLKVKFWCPVTDVIVQGYQFQDETFLSFMAFGESEFRDRNGSPQNLVQTFKVMDCAEHSITSSLQKAKVLQKTTSFHLFSDQEGGILRLYCAHERHAYKSEASTAPIVILLNLNHDEIERVFDDHPHVYLVLNASFLNHHTVHISGHDRSGKYKVEEIVGIADLRESVREMLSQAIDAFYHSSHFSNVVIQGYEKSLAYFADSYAKETLGKAILKVAKDMPLGQGMNKITSESLTAGEQERNVSGSSRNISAERSKPLKNYGEPNADSENLSVEAASTCMPKLFLLSLFHKLGKKKRKTPRKSVPADIRVKESEKKVPGTENPCGKKQVYESIYKPVPTLRESSISSAPVSEREPQHRNFSTNTGSSSHYTNTSLQVQSNFQFPPGPAVENAITDGSHSKPATLPVKRVVSTVHEEGQIPDDQLPNTTITEINLPDIEKNDVMLDTVVDRVLESKEAAPQSPQYRVTQGKKLFSEGGIPSKPKKRVFLSQDIANALEQINAAGISPETYAKYKKYEELPTVDFYSDGEANWITITREDSSNLAREIRAMKEEANMDTLDVIDVGNAGSPLRMTPQKIRYNTSDGTISSTDNDGIDENLSQDTVKLQPPQPPAHNVLPTEESQESLSSFQYMSEFGRKLDEGFHLEDLWDQRSLPFTVDTLVVEEKEEPENKSTSDMHSLTVSSEEYFSPEEYMSAFKSELFPEEVDVGHTVTLSSSEKTLMNVAREFEKPDDDNGFQIKFDSVAYLSDILNGTVKI